MSSAERWVTLLVGIVALIGGVGAVLKVLWSIRGSWDQTNGKLERVVDRLEGMGSRDDRLERALERHLDWHDRH